MTTEPPTPEFDRSDVTAIVRRAIEVAHYRQPDHDEQLSVEDLADIADEVGLSRSALVTAVAEQRAGVEHRQGVVDRLVGPGQVWAISQLSYDEEAAVVNLQRWLEVDHGLRTRYRADGVMLAEPRTGLLGAISAGLNRVRGTGGLNRARSVQAATAAIDGHRSVCVVADVTNKRGEAIVGGSAVAGGTAIVIGVFGILLTPVALAALPVGLGFGVVTARLIHQQSVQSVADQIELTTEAVIRYEQPVHPVERFIRTRLGSLL